MAYSIEERTKAVELYVRYGCSAADAIRELGYPSRQALRNWYGDYLRDGEIRGRKARAPKFSDEQKRSAVDHYLEPGIPGRRGCGE